MKITLVAEKFELKAELEKYAQKKLQGLEKYVPHAARESASIEARFKQTSAKDKKHSTCELTLHLPGENLFALETTGHMHSALDVATAHIRQQLETYKTKRLRKLRKRFSRKSGGEMPSDK